MSNKHRLFAAILVVILVISMLAARIFLGAVYGEVKLFEAAAGKILQTGRK